MKVSLLLPAYPLDKQQVVLDDYRFSTENPQLPWQSVLLDVLGLVDAQAICPPDTTLSIHSPIEKQSAPETGNIVRADPIHLRPDRDNATLIPPEQLLLSIDEADELLATLNDFFSADELSFNRHSPHEWFLSGCTAESPNTYPPSFLAHRNTSAYLPEGDSMAIWRRTQTEVQMILHTHPVNHKRQQRGLMPINSVWFWGGGELPDPPDSFVGSAVSLYSDANDYCNAVSEHLNVSHVGLEDFSEAVLQGGSPATCAHHIVVDTSVMRAWLAADNQQMNQAVDRIDEQWLLPLRQGIVSARVSEIELLGEDGVIATLEASLLQADRSRGSRLAAWLRQRIRSNH